MLLVIRKEVRRGVEKQHKSINGLCDFGDGDIQF